MDKYIDKAVHGIWFYGQEYEAMTCSICGESFNLFENSTEKFSYCPNCGAKMEKENKNA